MVLSASDLAREADLSRWPAVQAVAKSNSEVARRAALLAEFSPELLRMCEGWSLARSVLAGRRLEPDGTLAERVRLATLEIALDDLDGSITLETTVHRLSDLADTAIDEAFAEAMEAASKRPRWSVVALGKLGARELNYSSDIDIMVVAEEPRAVEAAVRSALAKLRTAFRVDLNLRPEGRSGPICRSLASYVAYWKQWARPWERQAMLKGRLIGDGSDLSATFAQEMEQFVFGTRFAEDDLRELRQLKARAEGLLSARGLLDRDVKLGHGGIRDIEFPVQVLQLVHGYCDPALRVRGTLEALELLADGGYVERAAASQLARDYQFLRTVEHRLQLRELTQTHVIPLMSDPQYRQLARSVGYRDRPDTTAEAAFAIHLTGLKHRVRRSFEQLYFHPLLEALALGTSEPGRLSDVALGDRLAALGFLDARTSRVAVAELGRALKRSPSLFQQLLPMILEALSASPNPRQGLIGLRNLVAAEQKRDRLTSFSSLLRDSPSAIGRLSQIAGTSGWLTHYLMEDPESIRNRIESFDGQPSRVLARALSRLAWRDPSQRPEALIRWQHREILGLLLSRLEPTGFWLSGESFSEALSAIAEATLISSLDLLSPPGPVAVIGLGHLGGHEMALGSDLDLMLVAGDQVDPVDLDRFAQSYMLCLSRLGLYPIDLRLRPEGRNGAIARTVSSYRAYYQRWGTTWERQALLKARVVAGDRHLRAQVSPMIEDAIFSRPFGPAEIREIRLMKARVEKERLGPREDPRFHLKFGAGALADVEWTVQLLQLKHRIGGTQTVPTLEAMARRGIVHPEDAETLTASYRLCTQLRNQCFLVSGHALSSLPSQVDLLGTLARSLDTSPSELRESFLRVTRRARRVTEKLFYGLGS